jgi:Acetyltransferase (GNAT) domain
MNTIAHTILETYLASSLEDSARWNDIVNRSPTPDIYYRPGYVNAYADEHSDAVAVTLNCCGRRFLLPLLIRRIAHLPFAITTSDYDAGTPYGYGGLLPLDSRELSYADITAVIAEMKRWCRYNNVVSCMVRLHPLLTGNLSLDLAQSAGDSLRLHGPTKAIDLASWDTKLNAPAGMNSNRRRNLVYARRNLTLIQTSCERAGAAEYLDRFREIYEETMQRVNAASSYYFPREYYDSLARGTGGKMKVALAMRGSTVVSGAIFFMDSAFGHFHLGGTTAEGRKYKASTMVMIAGAEWMRREGCRWFHLGGGRAAGDSLYSFKDSFGGATFFYFYLTIVADQGRYDRLVALRDEYPGLGERDTTFFPAYRA